MAGGGGTVSAAPCRRWGPVSDRNVRRLNVLAGITGWAQVNHPYDQSLDDVRRKVEFDLEYIRRRSPVEDLRIMARTLPVMVRRQGSL